MTDQIPTAADRTMIGNHTYSCALTTRGGVCDCWSSATDPASALADQGSPSLLAGADTATISNGLVR
jgi:hypothetical protein